MKLPGIGEYTAAAISSFAFLKPTPVVDGNVIRFISRLFGIEKLFTTDNSKKELYLLLNKLINKKRPDIFNNAIMEFGALQCKPLSPNCEYCIFKNDCFAFRQNRVNELPLKVKKKINPKLYLNYLVFVFNDNKKRITWLNKRTEKGIWQNLYDFPCIESVKNISFKQIKKNKIFLDLISDSTYHLVMSSLQYQHKLTHKTFFVHFHIIEIEKKIPVSFNKYTKSTLKEIQQFPVSRLIELFLEDQQLKFNE